MWPGSQRPTGDVAVFRDCLAPQTVALSVECVAACENTFLLGTSDGKIAVYDLERAAHGQWDAQLVHMFSARHQQPFRSLIPWAAGGVLFAATADALFVHRLPLGSLNRHWEGGLSASASTELLAQTSTVGGLKDIVDCSARVMRGAVLLAVLTRRKLLVYEYIAGGGGGELVKARECPALPDGARCIAWTAKGVLVGLRKNYCMFTVPSSGGGAAVGQVEQLYAVGKRASGPFLLSMAPVPEVLVGVEASFVRALADGRVVGGDDGGADALSVPWASASTPSPLLSTYHHPYLVAGQPACVEVYLPLVTTLAPDGGDGAARGAHKVLCQSLPFAPQHLTRRGLVDLDERMPDRATGQGAVRRDALVALDAARRIHVLEMAPAAEQARAFAAANLYGVSELVCRLCPGEVTEEVARLAAVVSAAHAFLEGRYAQCMRQLREADAHPLLAVHLFGAEMLPAAARDGLYTPPAEAAPVLAKCAAQMSKAAAADREEARAALTNWLTAKRLQLSAAGRDGEGLLSLVDTALMKAMTLSSDDAALLDLLRDANRCDAAEAAEFLASHARWVALAALRRAEGAHETAVLTLLAVAATGRAGGVAAVADLPPLPPDVAAALGAVAAAGYDVPSELTPQSHLCSTVRGAAPALAEAPTTQAAVLLAALSYLRGLSLANAGHHRVFEVFAPWLLAHVPPTSLSLSILLGPQNRRMYREVLALAQNALRPHSGGDASGGVSALAVIADLQAQILADFHPHIAVRPLAQPGGDAADGAEADGMAEVHAGYWQNLALLVFGGARGDPTPVEARRQQLRDFLRTSSQVDCTAAEEFFEDDEIKAASRPERAVVYARLGSHAKAVDMFLDEMNSLPDAKEYCAAVQRQSADDGAYLALVGKLLRRRAGAAARPAEALALLRESVGVSAQAVLPMLPDDLPARELHAFILQAVQHQAAASHSGVLEAAVHEAEERRLSCLLAAEQSKGIAIAADGGGHVCVVCGKRIRPDAAFLHFPNALVAHVGCGDDIHRCPCTGADFRHGLLPRMLGNE